MGENGQQIVFRLQKPTILLNVLTRKLKNPHARKRALQALAWEIRAATMKTRPQVPFHRALVKVERYSTRTPDEDGMVGGLKLLLDALQPASTRHPFGQGIIANDSPAHMKLEAIAVLVKAPEDQCTIVTITKIAD